MSTHSATHVHPDDIPEMEGRLAACGSSVAEMCRRAQVAETTWGRWKRREVSPTFRTWGEVVAAYRDLTGAGTPEGAKP